MAITTTNIDGTPNTTANFHLAQSIDGQFAWYFGSEGYFRYAGRNIYCQHPDADLSAEVVAAGRAFVGEVMAERESRYMSHAVTAWDFVPSDHDGNCPANLGGACECDVRTR
jgi:hypothetical protein